MIFKETEIDTCDSNSHQLGIAESSAENPTLNPGSDRRLNSHQKAIADLILILFSGEKSMLVGITRCL
ncbi:MAG: hypothetical protein VKL42_11265 [Snowella sp.]|nr:hypothetical protein [Snowella sp.]